MEEKSAQRLIRKEEKWGYLWFQVHPLHGGGGGRVGDVGCGCPWAQQEAALPRLRHKDPGVFLGASPSPILTPTLPSNMPEAPLMMGSFVLTSKCKWDLERSQFGRKWESF